ncbi:LytTR family DNA-binding domain-containing protein [Mangrovivirga cuniculi]|uniref:LytTR family DNA-binding domain-containing protein n=1 Tax=Mangrovivirga cuniculi TaxID=2715131 RepID=UPI001FE5F21B|nr:LytTR family DNA-binding domain-containing protein [Mangrovivirga cuniculi]
MKTKLIRNSLKNIEKEFEEHLVRSQRSYLVNIQSIQYIDTSGQKTVLAYPHDLQVPVSPKYKENFVQLDK